MSNLDKALNIYQSYSLAKISALNKKSLAIQYAQCGEIVKLEKSISKELQAISQINKQILENQINELKQRERVKFYKKVAFNAKEAIEIINSHKDLLFKSFLCELYAVPLRLLLEDAISNLEEISDKEFCSKQIKIVDSCLKVVEPIKEDYDTSDYHSLIISQEPYLALMKEYESQIKQVNKEKKNIAPFVADKTKSMDEYNGCNGYCLIFFLIVTLFIIFGVINSVGDELITGIVLLGISIIIVAIFYRRYSSRKKKYAEYVENVNSRNVDKQNEYERKINQINEMLKLLQQEQHNLSISHPYIVSLGKINFENPGWKKVVEKIEKYIPKEEKGTENQAQLEYFDPLFEDAARLIVREQSGSTSLIQRKFAIGYNRAGRLMEQLEKAGVVGASHGLKPREVLIQDETTLINLLNCFK